MAKPVVYTVSELAAVLRDGGKYYADKTDEDLVNRWKEKNPDKFEEQPRQDFDEPGFQQWYSGMATQTGLDADPDHPAHKYNYRAAYSAGAQPEVDQGGGEYHWPSRFMDDDHPDRFVGGVDTKTGKPIRSDIKGAFPRQVAAAVREKYNAYKDVADEELSNVWLRKYPGHWPDEVEAQGIRPQLNAASDSELARTIRAVYKAYDNKPDEELAAIWREKHPDQWPDEVEEQQQIESRQAGRLGRGVAAVSKGGQGLSGFAGAGLQGMGRGIEHLAMGGGGEIDVDYKIPEGAETFKARATRWTTPLPDIHKDPVSGVYRTDKGKILSPNTLRIEYLNIPEEDMKKQREVLLRELELSEVVSVVARNLQTSGRAVFDYATENRKLLEQYAPTRRFVDAEGKRDWTVFGSPQYLVETFLESATSMSQAMVFGQGAAPFMGALMEAGPYYDELLRNEDPQAAQKALAFGMVVAALEKIGFDAMFKKVPKGGMKKVMQTLTTMITEGTTESLENPMQTLIDVFDKEGMTRSEKGKMFLAAWNQGLNEGIGGLMGAGGVSIGQALPQHFQEKLAAEVKKDIQRLNATKEAEDVTERTIKVKEDLSPLEQADRVPKAPKAKRRASGMEGVTTIGEAVIEAGGLRQSKVDPETKSKPWNEEYQSTPMRYKRKTGMPPDLLKEELVRMGFMTPEQTIDDMFDMMKGTRKVVSEAKFYRDKAEGHQNWVDNESQEVTPNDLQVGSTFTVKGEQFRVLEETDTAIHVKDGENYWVSYEEDGSILIDDKSLVDPVTEAPGVLPEEEEAAPVEADPTARPRNIVEAKARIVQTLEKGEAAIKERIRQRNAEGRMMSGVDPEVMGDYVALGAIKFAKGATEIGAWSAQMVAEFGEAIRPHLKQIYAKARAQYENTWKMATDEQAEFDLNLAERTEEVPDGDFELMQDWFREVDLQEHQANVDTAIIQQKLKDTLGKKARPDDVRRLDMAGQVYADLRGRSQEQAEKYKATMQPHHIKILEQSQNLTDEQKAIAEELRDLNIANGLEGQEEGVIRNVLDEYTKRLWIIPGKAMSVKANKFIRSIKHGRKLESILEGWSSKDRNGNDKPVLELRLKGATTAYQYARVQTVNAIANNRMVQAGKDIGVFTTDPNKEGYTQIDNPAMTDPKWVGVAKEAEIYSGNFFATEDGDLFEKAPIYAPEELADKLNKIIGRQDVDPSITSIEKFNAATKQILLTTSLFHHQAYIRSYMLGGHITIKDLFAEPVRSAVGVVKYIFKDANPLKIAGRAVNPFGQMIAGIKNMKGYQQGQQAIFNQSATLKLLVGEGLTIGKVQDWDEASMKEINDKFKTALDKSKYLGGKIPLEIINKVVNFQNEQTRILFQEVGPFLKAQAATLEFNFAVKLFEEELANGEVTEQELAATVAKLINDDFGGLHHKRLGRSERRTRLLRGLELAEDWTHSNVRSMVKTVTQRNAKTGKIELASGYEGKLYRRFWAGILTKATVGTALWNFIMASMDSGDDDENTGEKFVRNFKTAWDEGKLRWMDVDITPVYQALRKAFGKNSDDKRKYFSLIGHFRDPIKFLARDTEAFKHKGSIFMRYFLDAMSGENWAGRRFTTTAELRGTDDKGVYLSSKAGEYGRGDPRGGKLKGKLVSRTPGQGKPVSLNLADMFKGESSLPSYALYELKATMPIQAQAALSFAIGEIDAFDAITKGMGLMTSTTYPKTEEQREAKLITDDLTQYKDYADYQKGVKIARIGVRGPIGRAFKKSVMKGINPDTLEEYRKFVKKYEDAALSKYRVKTPEDIASAARAVKRHNVRDNLREFIKGEISKKDLTDMMADPYSMKQLRSKVRDEKLFQATGLDIKALMKKETKEEKKAKILDMMK